MRTKTDRGYEGEYRATPDDPERKKVKTSLTLLSVATVTVGGKTQELVNENSLDPRLSSNTGVEPPHVTTVKLKK